MPLEQTITVVNNSGKIISTGKQLLSIFKEAKGAYQDKKAELKSQRSTLRRAQTFDQARSVYRSTHDDHTRAHAHAHEHEPDDYDYKYEYGPREYDYGNGLAADYYGRRRSYDVCSDASSRRSHRSSSSRHHRHHHHPHPHGSRSRPALTESNLKTLSEVSSTAPCKAPPPAAYRSPYAETLPVDMALSKLDLRRTELRSIAETERQRDTAVVPRRRSEPDMGGGDGGHTDIDMHLAYGNVPPDLAERVDLDPGHAGDEWTAHQLVHKVEGLLDEAHCLQHSATAIIKHLQEKPDAAAAVALTLAELSTAVAKMSPAFLGFLKGGSPAVFALLASPQFLIGTGIAVGVTVVMFGGWKIVKKVQEAQAARQLLLAHEGAPQDGPVPLRTQSEYSAGVDEALVVDEELSTIETWRRGIPDESADLELITPQADRATREKYTKDDFDFDLRSRRSARTHRSGKTHRTSSHRDKGKERDDVPERKSSRGATAESISGASDARSKKSGRGKENAGVKAIEDGRSRRGDDDGFDAVFRPKMRQDNMLKAIFKGKKDKEKSRSELVLA
ncbi:Uncharacterized protein TPAR_06414 [Tolypocladium paradoxum]|uniref:Uncharacterized protein n=1 Tax=Tolypocladium paradoxum TaxID=94208 RepID=A0A2S4KT82_9HYPO|nr:Uncharacterized protein TPAR_06414 [Tolypocladium paradoxum]